MLHSGKEHVPPKMTRSDYEVADALLLTMGDKPEPLEFETNLEYETLDDGGQALVLQADIPNPEPPKTIGNELFLRLQSWNEEGHHKTLNQWLNRKVRIRIEVVD